MRSVQYGAQPQPASRNATRTVGKRSNTPSKMVEVNCHVERVEGFSAHADWKAVLRWLEGLPDAPKQVFTTHGEPDAAEAMAEHIRERFGWDVMVPQYRQTVELT